MVKIQYNASAGAFYIEYPFCVLRFYLIDYMKTRTISNIKWMNPDVFKYSCDGVEEYESISRRIVGEMDVNIISYTITPDGYRLHRYDADIITTLTPDDVIKRICESCERGDAEWILQKASN